MFSASFTTLALVGLAAAKVKFLGVSISGDLGCATEGACRANSTLFPPVSLGANNSDSEGHMKHFATNDAMNIFRLPISWQSLTNSNLTGPLHRPSLAQYDRLVQSCLATGAHCIISPHNAADITGQPPSSGPSDSDLTRLWTELAKPYAASPSVVFELTQPLPDTDPALGASASQRAVTAIRDAGATAQMILLPGLAFSSVEEAQSTGDALAKITNPNGSTQNLLFGLRKYLDDGGDGTEAQCTTNNNAAFQTAAGYLRGIGRQAVVSETGAAEGDDRLCLVWFCEQNRFVNENADVFVGLVASGVGTAGEEARRGLTPVFEGGRLVDTPMMSNCVVGTWMASSGEVVDGGGKGIVTAVGGRVGVAWGVLGGGLGVGLLGW